MIQLVSFCTVCAKYFNFSLTLSLSLSDSVVTVGVSAPPSLSDSVVTVSVATPRAPQEGECVG